MVLHKTQTHYTYQTHFHTYMYSFSFLLLLELHSKHICVIGVRQAEAAGQGHLLLVASYSMNVLF